MRPNTLVLPLFLQGGRDLADSAYPDTRGHAIASVEEYEGVVGDALNLHVNVLVACNFRAGAEASSEPPVQDSQATTPLLAARTGGTIDVWLWGEWGMDDLEGTLSLQLQLAHIIRVTK